MGKISAIERFSCSYIEQLTTSKGGTWSRSTNSRLLFAVNAMLNLSNIKKKDIKQAFTVFFLLVMSMLIAILRHAVS